jgi:hypothetical protein
LNPFDDERDLPIHDGNKRKPSKAEEVKSQKRALARSALSNVYAFFNALIVALCGADSGYEATEISLLESGALCPRQAGHADYPIDVACADENKRKPFFSLLIPACHMPAHLWVWPGSHRLMEHVINANYRRGHHAAGLDFYVEALQQKAGMELGTTIAPVDVVVGGAQACAFLGHVVHAGAENFRNEVHYRFHCYCQLKDTGKEHNSANSLPMCVAELCSDSVRMLP